MKVAIYCRISRDDQQLDTQEAQCIKHCETHHYPIYGIYRDVFTGATDNRPSFNQLQDDMRHYKFDCVMVTKLDRIGRSLKHLLNLFDEFNRKGIYFIATTQNIDTSSSMGKLQLQILGAFAEFERNMISERTKEGLKGKLNVGKRGPDKKPRKKRGVLKKRIFYPQDEPS